MIRTECIGDSCNFGTLLNDEGKLGNNWVRGALLSIERNPSAFSDVREVFYLFDTNIDGMLNAEESAEVFANMGVTVTDEEAQAYFAAADEDGDGLITFRQFLAQYKNSGQEVVDDESDGLKAIFSFQNVMD